MGLVAARMGFMIVTGSMTKQYSSEIAYRPLVEPRVEVDYGLALRRDAADPAEAALRTVAAHLTKLY